VARSSGSRGLSRIPSSKAQRRSESSVTLKRSGDRIVAGPAQGDYAPRTTAYSRVCSATARLRIAARLIGEERSVARRLLLGEATFTFLL